MRILVCGGRDFANPVSNDYSPENQITKKQYSFVLSELDKLAVQYSKEYKSDGNWLPTDITIIEGNAKGVDRAARDWATINYANLKVFSADWEKYGKSAGFIRNQQMLDEGKPDLVVAFPGGTGTADMIRRAKKAGVEVKEIKYDTI